MARLGAVLLLRTWSTLGNGTDPQTCTLLVLFSQTSVRAYFDRGWATVYSWHYALFIYYKTKLL